VPIESLPPGVQQRVEILKMLYRQVDVLILDEPTAVLTALEVQEFFQTLRSLRATGKTIVLITHKLKEVLTVTDRITVLQQGQVTGRLQTKDATPEVLAHLMVGRAVLPTLQKKPASPGALILQVQGLHVHNDLAQPAVADLSFAVHAGEILGIAGVEGNGQTELVEAITGLRPVVHGNILLDGQDITGFPPRVLYHRGLAHIPGDRRRVGMVLDFSVAENSILGVHRTKQFQGIVGNIAWPKVYVYTRDLIKNFAIVASDVRVLAKSLSGGNQQKLVLARELGKHPGFVVAVQPTQGLDIASTQYIRDQLLHLRDQGKAILLVSADLDEIFQLSDRIAVMYGGRFMGIATPHTVDVQQVGLMIGGVPLPSVTGSPT
jgi:simple sugar transport system ATP-binding protein